MTQTCPQCKKEPAIIHTTFGVLPGEICKARQTEKAKNVKAQNPEFLTQSMQDRIQSQRDKNEKDILQPYMGNRPNESFAKAYPELAHEYFTTEELEAM